MGSEWLSMEPGSFNMFAGLELTGQEPCEKCGCKGAYMYNCDHKGRRLPGLLCLACWKAIHPIMGEPKRAVNPTFWVFLLALVWFIAGLLILALGYDIKIVDWLLK